MDLTPSFVPLNKQGSTKRVMGPEPTLDSSYTWEPDKLVRFPICTFQWGLSLLPLELFCLPLFSSPTAGFPSLLPRRVVAVILFCLCSPPPLETPECCLPVPFFSNPPFTTPLLLGTEEHHPPRCSRKALMVIPTLFLSC